MSKKSITFAAAFLSMLAPLATASAEVLATYVFEAVDGYDIRGEASEVKITGVLQGESAARTITLTYQPLYSTYSNTDYTASIRTFERCERMVLIAMSKPGQYLLEVRQERADYVEYIGCKLTRR